MSDEVKTSHVTDFLRFTIGTSFGAFKADDAGYVIDAKGNRVALQNDAPLILYQEKVTDQAAQILNPFSEGIKESDASIWLYKMLRASLSARVMTVIIAVIEFAAEEHRQKQMTAAEKKKAQIEPVHLDPVLSNLVSSIVQKVDEKTVGEAKVLNKYISHPGTVSGLLYPVYVKKMLTTRLSIPIVENGDDFELPPTIRKGTLPVFRTLLLAMFGIKDADGLDKFTAKAHDDSTPKIDATMRCLFRVYSQLNPVMDALDDTLSIDLSEFKYHLDRMPAYSQNARSITSVARPQPSPHTSLPVQHATHIGATAQQDHQAPSSRPHDVIPSFVTADGKWGPVIEVAGPNYGYTGPPMPMRYGQPQQQQPNFGGQGGDVYGSGYAGASSYGAMPQQPVFDVYDVPVNGPSHYTYNRPYSHAVAPGVPAGWP